MRLALALLAALAATGCINLQAGYDNAARSECNRDPDDTARRACLDHLDHDRANRAHKSQSPAGS